MSEPNDDQVEAEQPLIAHLLELRSRLLKAIIGVAVVLIPLLFFYRPLFHYVALPLIQRLPQGSHLIATRVIAPFFTPFKLAIVVAVIISIPWVLYQIWAFIAPGLYRREKRMMTPLLLSSTLLFYAGMSFAYFVVFPLVFNFIVKVAPQGVTVMTDISEYLDFVLTMFMAFGVAFELPVAIVLMVWTGFVTPAQLGAKRPYVLVAAFVAGMLLTPPDLFSQTMLAVPVYLLYELGIWASKLLVPGARYKDDSSSEGTDDDGNG
jgi:sec-independent protein translocase protein TatC